jgi:mannosyltransferase OCH1-like enzyme
MKQPRRDIQVPPTPTPSPSPSRREPCILLRFIVFILAINYAYVLLLYAFETVSIEETSRSPVQVSLDDFFAKDIHNKNAKLETETSSTASAVDRVFHTPAYNKIRQLVNASSLITWTNTNDKFWEELNITAVLSPYLDIEKIHGRSREDKVAVWSNTNQYYIWESNICFAAKRFADAGSIKPHVLFTYCNENRGAFSRDVENRTAAWNKLATRWTSWNCSDEEIFEYLNNPNTRAVFTTQHQSYEHPKAHSLPLGVIGILKWAVLKHINLPKLDRTQLLMINDNGWKHRKQITDRVMATFAKHNMTLVNTYKKGDNQQYLEELRKSKFILAPSGLGWDCYRIYEAIYLGCIPIVERYHRPHDGWRRTLDGLPVLWVESFEEVMPSLLEKEYLRIASRANQYTYEKLTIQWWVSYIRSFMPEDTSTPQSLAEKRKLHALAQSQQIKELLELNKTLQINSHSHNLPVTFYDYDLSADDQSTSFSVSSSHIPRILHFVYVTQGLPTDQGALPAQVLEHIRKWQDLHPAYVIALWNNQAIRQSFPELIPILERIKTMSWVSDLVRFHALERHGGIHLDVDIVPMKSLDRLRQDFGPAFTVCEKSHDDIQSKSLLPQDYTTDECELISNAVIGGRPQHPAFSQALKTAMANTKNELDTNPNQLKTSGSPVWTQSVQAAAKRNEKDDGINVLKSSLFFPCNWDTKDSCQPEFFSGLDHVYGIHQWTASSLRGQRIA